jgi:hypothetical protein
VQVCIIQINLHWEKGNNWKTLVFCWENAAWEGGAMHWLNDENAMVKQ